ncbi:MAG: ribosome-associated translation inhibitor RaiA [Candidatus Colwellbacteria bacterium]|nr:ribosome-associated translation inhibitor RaiA [Candidatus Colwellbacteria bacterium]
MRINIQAPNLELTPALTEYIETKIGGLEKFLKKFNPENVLARVDVGRGSKHHRHGKVYHVDVNLLLPHGTIRATHDDEDIRKAINAVRDILQREIEKFKETHNS